MLWFFDRDIITDFYQLDSMPKDSLFTFSISRTNDALHIWSNVSEMSYVDKDRALIICNGRDMDPLYYATTPLKRYVERDSIEVCFKRMYAKLIVDVAGEKGDNYVTSIKVTGSNSGYYANCELVEEKLVIEKKRDARSLDYSNRFTVNIGKQRSFDDLLLTIIMADGSERVYNLGLLLLEKGIESSEDEDFFNDIYIFIDLEEYEITIDVDSWKNGDSVEIEY